MPLQACVAVCNETALSANQAPPDGCLLVPELCGGLPGAGARAQYLPCFAAAGTNVQFFAIPRGSPHVPVAITPIVSMANPMERAHLVLYCVKVWRTQR